MFLQLRSTIVKNRRDEFLDDILNWATNQELGKIVVLASFAADERIDSQIVGIPIRFLANRPEVREELKALKWEELERKNTFPSLAPRSNESADSLFIPGGGLAKSFYNKRYVNFKGKISINFSNWLPLCSLKSKVTLVELLTFASEGDNTGDAVRMVAFLDEWMKVVPKVNDKPSLKFPISWNHMFGNSAPNQIY